VKGAFNNEGFQLIEKRGSVTVGEFAKKFGIKKRSAATWLSKWTNYYNEARGIVQHFLVHEKERGKQFGVYRTGPDWWGERYFDSAKEDTYEDEHNMNDRKTHDRELYGGGREKKID